MLTSKSDQSNKNNTFITDSNTMATARTINDIKRIDLEINTNYNSYKKNKDKFDSEENLTIPTNSNKSIIKQSYNKIKFHSNNGYIGNL